MSNDEENTILLNTVKNFTKKSSNIKRCIIKYGYIQSKKLRKPIPKHTGNLTPLTTESQEVLVSVVSVFAGSAFGYDIGIGTEIASSVKKDFLLNCNEENMITNVWFFGCLIGAIVGGFLIDTCGRRYTMISSLVFLTFGSMLSALANHYILFLVARIICGFSGTVSAMTHCIYMAEISSSSQRGYNITLHQSGAAVGYLIAIIIVTNKNEDCQRNFAVGIISVPALITCIITIIFLQRSPSFLLLKRVVNVPRIPAEKSWYCMIETVIVMIIMLALGQGTGRHQVLYYAPRLFALLGICANMAKSTSMIALSVVRVFSTILCLVVVEKCGRRTAMITSATLCMTAVSLLSILATLDSGNELLNFPNESCSMILKHNTKNDFLYKFQKISSSDPNLQYPFLPTPLAMAVSNTKILKKIKTSCEAQNIILSDGLSGTLKILAVVTLLVFESAYALGLGSIPLLTLSEVYPAAIRGKCVGFSILTLWIFYALLHESIGKITRVLTLAGAYFFYSFMCLITIFYIFLFYPETKGKSLNQIAEELRKISLASRICNNMQSLPRIFHIKWIIKFNEKVNQSTPI